MQLTLDRSEVGFSEEFLLKKILTLYQRDLLHRKSLQSIHNENESDKQSASSVKVLGCPSALSAEVPECPKCLSAQVPQVPECPSALQVPKCPPNPRVLSKCPSAPWVLSECPSAWVLSECLQCSSALWVSLNACPVPECLIRCDLNKMLSMKTCFMQKERNAKRKKW